MRRRYLQGRNQAEIGTRQARWLLPCVGLFALPALCHSTPRPFDATTIQKNNPAVRIGEQLFAEFRFSQFFAANSPSGINAELMVKDPTVTTLKTVTSSIPNPIHQDAISCRSCHFTTEAASASGLTPRSFGDYSKQSPIPFRTDNKLHTLRNSPTLLDAISSGRYGLLLHYDGEFTTTEDLVRAGFLGRNYGWLPKERAVAIQHIARVIREDNGQSSIATEFTKRSYRSWMDSSTPPPDSPTQLLPQQFKLDFRSATDEEIIDLAARLVAEYLKSLTLRNERTNRFDRSPYDSFLAKNRLPTQPYRGETDLEYAQRLIAKIKALKDPRFVDEKDGSFSQLNQPYKFGAEELRGLRVFFNSRGSRHSGNCVTCHVPPSFTDRTFHNIGVSQSEFEKENGPGSFPKATSILASPLSFDLGAFNVLNNPDTEKPHRRLRRMLCADNSKPQVKTKCGPRRALALAIGAFKTPSVRALSYSDPYFHSGNTNSLREAILFYRDMSKKARRNELSNPDKELKLINIEPDDASALAAFLRSLDQDIKP